jgi:hypothetical protein
MMRCGREWWRPTGGDGEGKPAAGDVDYSTEEKMYGKLEGEMPERGEGWIPDTAITLGSVEMRGTTLLLLLGSADIQESRTVCRRR